MSTNTVPRADQFALRVTNDLAAEFSGSVSRTLVTNVVREVRRDLESRILPEAIEDVLHPLARHRLNVMCVGDPGWG